jgi:drug/metabolite transporter (DMT)-like permease
VSFALFGVAAAALCSGTAAVLQARAARQESTRPGLDAGLLVRLARRPAYVAALALVVAGFALSFLALRTLPLFVVQSGRASSLAVTAVLAVVLLRTRLSRLEIGAVVGVVGGLVMLAASASADRSDDVPAGTRLGLLLAVGALVLVASLVARRPAGPRVGLTLGVLSGLSFAVLALGARIVRGFSPAVLVVDPAAWAMGLAGLLGLLLAAMALQRTTVVAATAAMVATETVVGSALGAVLSGDRPLPGSTGTAVAGFALVLAGALSLARFGAPDQTTATAGDAARAAHP